jgi:type I restriction-modification system DNA methylase subunit
LLSYFAPSPSFWLKYVCGCPESLAYVIAIMNMILHGIGAPNIIHANTLTENLSDIQNKDRFDIVLA